MAISNDESPLPLEFLEFESSLNGGGGEGSGWGGGKGGGGGVWQIPEDDAELGGMQLRLLLPEICLHQELSKARFDVNLGCMYSTKG